MPENLSWQLHGAYTMMSAALHNFLPHIPVAQHIDIFRELRLHLHLSRLEQTSMDTVSNALIEGEVTARLNKPHIICTYHTGSFRMINLWLIKNQINFALVTSDEVLQREGDAFKSFYQQHNTSPTKELEIINASQSTGTLKMIRALKAGKSLVLYIDGNSGMDYSQHTCTVRFLQSKLKARTGIAFLSHKTNTPILPVCCYRPDGLAIHIKFGNFIVPDEQASCEQYAAKTTRQLFNFIAPVIKNYPAQWEGWLYIHKVACINSKKNRTVENTTGKQVMFNQQDFGVFQVEQQSFLLEKNAYKVFPIPAALRRRIQQAITKPIPLTGFKETVLKELSLAGVLKFI